jgi:hypothetical protein
MISANVGDEVSTGGFADERDAVCIYLIDWGIVLDPADRFFNVMGIGRKFVIRGETIVDAEPCEFGVGEWLEKVSDVLPLIACDPSATVY